MTKLDERKKIEVIDQKYKLSRVITFDDICKCRQQAQFALEREQVDSFEIQSSTKRAAKKRLQEFPETWLLFVSPTSEQIAAIDRSYDTEDCKYIRFGLRRASSIESWLAKNKRLDLMFMM